MPALAAIRLIALRLFAALLLATIGAQAALPLSAPLERTHGSAFSATTHEVALVAQRKVKSGRHALAPSPVPHPPAPAPVRAQNPPELALLPAPRPQSTGPPRPHILARLAAPRPPPSA